MGDLRHRSLASGPVASLGGGVRYGLLNEILPEEGYVLGRSVLNMSVGTMQICGFAVGGVLVATLSPRGTLLRRRGAVPGRGGRRAVRPQPPPAARRRTAVDRADLAEQRAAVVVRAAPLRLSRAVGAQRADRRLRVPLRALRARGTRGCSSPSPPSACWLGDTLAGRFVPRRWRERLGAPLRLLLAAPYLVFALHPALPVAVAAVVLASVGYSASLLLQQRLMALTPDELSGHALGLHSSGMLAMQGVGAAIAGAVAQQTSPGAAMAVMAAISVAVTLVLAPGLRPGRAPRHPMSPAISPRAMIRSMPAAPSHSSRALPR